MRVELRQFKQADDSIRTLVLFISESKTESKIIDHLGEKFDHDGLGPKVKGEVRLADGFREHYIALEAA